MLSNVTNRLLLRWTMWGNANARVLAMLGDSIRSFRPYFAQATFVISYHQGSVVASKGTLPEYVQWHSLPNCPGVEQGDELWLKWFPQDITEHADVLISLDMDVFC